MRRAALLGALGSAVMLPRLAAAQTGPLVRVGVAPNDPYMEPYYAQDLGLFANAGLNVQIQQISNGGAIVQAAAGNAIDVGVGELMQLANAIQKGVPFAVFAGGALYSSTAPTLVLCVAKNASEAKPKDFEGKAIAIPTLNSMPAAALKLWLEKGGADLTKLRLIEMPLPQQAAAVARGTITAAMIGEPFISDNRDAIKPVADPLSAIAPSFYIGCFYGKRDWLAANAATVKKLAEVMYAAGRFSNTRPADSAVIEAKYVKLDPERLKTMQRNTFATSLDTKLMQPVLDLGVRYGMIPKPVAASDVIVRL